MRTPSVFWRCMNLPLSELITNISAFKSLCSSVLMASCFGGGDSGSTPLSPVAITYGPEKRLQRCCLCMRPVIFTSASVSARSFACGCSWSVAATYTSPSDVLSTNQFHCEFISSCTTEDTTPCTLTNLPVILPPLICPASTSSAFGRSLWQIVSRFVTTSAFRSGCSPFMMPVGGLSIPVMCTTSPLLKVGKSSGFSSQNDLLSEYRTFSSCSRVNLRGTSPQTIATCPVQSNGVASASGMASVVKAAMAETMDRMVFTRIVSHFCDSRASGLRFDLSPRLGGWVFMRELLHYLRPKENRPHGRHHWRIVS